MQYPSAPQCIDFCDCSGGSQSIASQAEMVRRVKNHKAGFVGSDSNVRPSATLADVLAAAETIDGEHGTVFVLAAAVATIAQCLRIDVNDDVMALVRRRCVCDDGSQVCDDRFRSCSICISPQHAAEGSISDRAWRLR